ncbi:hypothetical protein GCM10018966_085250 [Streptomyces yanii]
MATAYGRRAESKFSRSRLPKTIARISRTETTTPATVARKVTDRGTPAPPAAGGAGAPVAAAAAAAAASGGSVTQPP